MEAWFGVSWSDVALVVATTLLMYVSVVVGLRVAGRRTVSQMSAFDFVVTIAIGSLVAGTSLGSPPAYGRGLAALVTLLVAQQMVAVFRQRFPVTRRLLDFSPQVLYSDGKMSLRHNPLTAQITEPELYSKLRRHGITSMSQVKLVILEPDGRVSVLGDVEHGDLWQKAGTERRI